MIAPLKASRWAPRKSQAATLALFLLIEITGCVRTFGKPPDPAAFCRPNLMLCSRGCVSRYRNSQADHPRCRAEQPPQFNTFLMLSVMSSRQSSVPIWARISFSFCAHYLLPRGERSAPIMLSQMCYLSAAYNIVFGGGETSFNFIFHQHQTGLPSFGGSYIGGCIKRGLLGARGALIMPADG